MSNKKAKRDWKIILMAILNNPKVKALIAAGFAKLIDVSRAGLPFRKQVAVTLQVQDARIEALEAAIQELLKDKIESESPEDAAE
jgi:hypothetical protein